MRQKLPLTFWRTGGIISIGSFPISHPFEPRAILAGGSFYFTQEKSALNGRFNNVLFLVAHVVERLLSRRYVAELIARKLLQKLRVVGLFERR